MTTNLHRKHVTGRQVMTLSSLLFSAISLHASSPYAALVQGDGALAYYRFGDSPVRSNIFFNSASSGATGNATNTFNVHAFPGAWWAAAINPSFSIRGLLMP